MASFGRCWLVRLHHQPFYAMVSNRHFGRLDEDGCQQKQFLSLFYTSIAAALWFLSRKAISRHAAGQAGRFGISAQNPWLAAAGQTGQFRER